MSPAPFVKLSALVALVMLVMGLGGCPEDEVEVPNLFLEITSDAPDAGRLESLRILLVKGEARYPESAGDSGFNPTLGALDPASGPVLVSVAYDGDTFGDGRDVVVQILGRMGNRPVTRFEGTVDLNEALVFKVHLSALPPGCDDDEDGFLDCGIEGCCAAGSAFADCGGADANTNPWAVEAECEPCADTIDQDCRGGDVPCVDDDDDATADCAETCGRGDPRSGPGLPEICDGKDNDCDDQTDEGLTLVYRGEVFDKGDACGLGACGGGVVECDGQGGLRCSSEGQRAEAEDCGTAADDNCNGLVNEGCSLADFDGDGSLAPEDCNDNDAGVFPGRTREPCCPASAQGDPAAEAACDKNCDGDVDFCEAGDADGDGVTVAEGDCDDGDASVAPGKPERCGDGIDQDCAGGDLACAQVIDGDGDGWPSAVDCDDGEAAVGPGELEVCNGRDDDCDGLVDEGNPGGGGQCGTSDVGACAFGVEHCQNSSGVVGQVVCVGAIDAAAADVCDGRDEDCDGETDEDFRYEGLAIGQACVGVGACGAGTVECAPGRSDLATCSTNPDGSASEAASEVCDTLDNDCDGELNEGLDDVEDSTCLNLGVCAAGRQAIVATCNAEGVWLCDYGAVAGYEDGGERSCDGLDNDCDGLSDEDFAFTEPDGTVRGFGTGCDGADSDACRNGIVACAPGDVTRVVCSETGGPFEELCDGADNDCDGATDEDFLDTSDNRVRLSGALFAGDNGAYLGDACGAGACGGGEVICGSTTTLKCSTDPRTPASPSAPTDVCDELDNDCDGTTDESYIAGGTVKLSGALLAADNGKVKGASCGAGECAGGTVVCGSPTTLVCSTDVNGKTTVDGQTVTKTDTCNGLDDNCNGTTDDDFVATSGANRKPLANALFSGDNGKIKGASCGVGECAKPSAGTVVCNEEGTALLCSSDERAQTDLCDNLDNDCDGTTDDPYLAGGTVTLTNAKYTVDNGKVKNASCGTGLCASGKVVCTASKTALVCDTDTKATTEVCDDVDNDCDGTKDEGYLYNGLTVGTSCDGIGGCGFGTVVCAVGSTSTATCSTNPNGPLSQVQNELCDGVDNDCDDQTDEGFTYNNVSLGGGCTGVGACGSGTVVCSTQNTSAATCSTMPDGTASQATAEACDGIDNDCDGSGDEDFGLGTGCDGVGECGAGVIECAGASATRCSTNPGGSAYVAVAETCDGLDQDCDGVNDNGFENLDGDALADCVDGCVDVDGDGWGRDGVNSGCAGDKAGVLDCNDADGNTDDDDEDNVCIGLGAPCTGGATTSCSDNCPAIVNPDQLDIDEDGIGDACDGCVDVDGDGWGRDGFNSACVGGKAGVADCDDTADNTADIDADNVCDDEDTCVDVDGDGWGRDGVNSGCEGAKAGVVDCSDLAGNVVDDDADNVCDDGGEDFCGTGESVGCKDNCPTINNPTQSDIDLDELGDACDSCIDVDGDGWGRDGFNSGCVGKANIDDCDDTADNTSDVDHDNTCDNADNCVDADGDGWGRDGQNSACTGKENVADCNDEPDNVADADVGGGDNVCIDDGPVCTGGDTTDCSDNCPADPNPTQTDIDADGVGDVCDDCVDVDGDGWGRDGFNEGCAGEKAGVDDCDDTADNTADIDHDNTCDVADNCVDADGDGWGRTGQNSGCEAGKQGVTDCNDTPDNVVDDDMDNVCDDGGDEFCLTGETVGCKDNCPDDANNDFNGVQTDTDRDGKGDVCDQACLYGPTPYEICGDCLDNDCDGESDEVECVYMRTMVIDTDLEPVAAGYAVSITFDHTNLVDAGLSTAGGDDVRIYYKDPDERCDDLDALACYREIDRVLDPTSSFGQGKPTTLWFAVQDEIPEQFVNADYEVYFGVPDVVGPAADEAAVFHMADFFDREVSPDNDVAGWVETEEADTDLIVSGSQLVMGAADDDAYDPSITKSFAPISAQSLYGIYELRVGMNWIEDGETNWNIGTQLGDSSAMQAIVGDQDYPNDGIGPSMGWGGGASLGSLPVTTFATEVGGVLTSRGTFNVANDVRVTIDFESAVDPTYDVAGTGITATDVAFTTAQTSLDTLRLFGNGVAGGFSSKAWDYVMLRPVVGTGNEPVALFGLEERMGAGVECTLAATATVRYFLEDGASSPGTTSVADAMGNHPLTLTRASGSPDWLDYLQLGQYGLSFFAAEGGDGNAASAVIGEESALGQRDFTTAMSFEVVTTNTDVDADGTRYAMSLDNEDGAHVVSLGFVDGATVVAELRVAGNTNGGDSETSTWTWSVPFSYAGRVVLHLVVDTALSSDRVTLYYNGVALTLAGSTGTLTQGKGFHLIGNGSGEDSALFTLGNDETLGSSMLGRLSYAAIYPSALDTTSIERHALILLRHDD